MNTTIQEGPVSSLEPVFDGLVQNGETFYIVDQHTKKYIISNICGEKELTIMFSLAQKQFSWPNRWPLKLRVCSHMSHLFSQYPLHKSSCFCLEGWQELIYTHPYEDMIWLLLYPIQLSVIISNAGGDTFTNNFVEHNWQDCKWVLANS